MPRLEILSQGDEVINGQIVDTNAAWLAEQAVQMGFEVSRHTTVGDRLDDLTQVLQDIAQRTDCCISTGGLGPTTDDLTTEAASKAFNKSLVFDPIAFEQIQQFFKERGRAMADCNRKQAVLPQGSLRLDNHVGTAPGFALQYQSCWFAFVPGVPSEMRHLFLERIKPLLLSRFELKPSRLVTIRTVGIGESDLQQRIQTLTIPDEIQLGYRAELGDVQIKLLFPHDSLKETVDDLANAVVTKLGDFVYAVHQPGEPWLDLAAVIDQFIQAKNLSLALVETVSNGAISAKFNTALWLLSAISGRDIAGKLSALDLHSNNIDAKAAITQFAQEIQQTTKADVVLIQYRHDQVDTEISAQTKAILTTFLWTKDNCIQAKRTLLGDKLRQQQQATVYSMDILRRYLQDKPIS